MFTSSKFDLAMFNSSRRRFQRATGGRLVKFVLALVLGMVSNTSLCGQAPPYHAVELPFPDTDALISRVAQNQKEVEALLTQYTFTDKSTLYTIGKSGAVKSQHTDTYYLTPTPYEVFTLHISHDGKATSEEGLNKQEKEIEHKLQNYERKAQKNPDVRPKEALLFGDIIGKSQFTPLRWEDVDGTRMVVYSFAPKTRPAQHGSENDKIAGDMKGTVWITADSAEIARMEFTSVSSLGLNFLVNVKGFQGFVEQKKMNDGVWLPVHQDFTAQGREIIKGFRIRQVNEFTDYLKASTDVFQQIHSPSGSAANNPETGNEIKQ
jgi:hypothetical protein